MADPKRIQVRDRFFTVLDGIRAEDGYFYTPDMVTKNMTDFFKGPGKKRLTVYPDMGGNIVNHSGAVDETFYMTVHGIIENYDDPHEVAERMLQDLRHAIDTDAKNPSTGYLGGICLQVVMDESVDMNTGFPEEERVTFLQRFRCQITASDFSGL